MGTARAVRVESNDTTVTIKAIDKENSLFFTMAMYKDNPIVGFTKVKSGDHFLYGIDRWPAREKRDAKGKVQRFEAKTIYEFLETID
tara:strand:+ start:316 stop:576 length:261 start_codon:yes stop_codon:yes gene_type:complete